MGEQEDQRKFLHDLSTPLSVILGMLDIVIEDVKKNAPTLDKSIIKLEKTQKAANKLTDMIRARRQTLIDEQG